MLFPAWCCVCFWRRSRSLVFALVVATVAVEAVTPEQWVHLLGEAMFLAGLAVCIAHLLRSNSTGCERYNPWRCLTLQVSAEVASTRPFAFALPLIVGLSTILHLPGRLRPRMGVLGWFVTGQKCSVRVALCAAAVLLAPNVALSLSLFGTNPKSIFGCSGLFAGSPVEVDLLSNGADVCEG